MSCKGKWKLNRIMSIKELSTGSWVLVNGKPQQVREIQWTGSQWAITCSRDCIVARLAEGCPLTEDILRRNGFVKNGPFWDYDNREMTDDVIGFRLGQIANGFVLLTDFRTIYIQYVHRLQAALTLCGVDVDITI